MRLLMDSAHLKLGASVFDPSDDSCASCDHHMSLCQDQISSLRDAPRNGCRKVPPQQGVKKDFATSGSKLK